MRRVFETRRRQTDRTGKSTGEWADRRNGTTDRRNGYRTGGQKDITGEKSL